MVSPNAIALFRNKDKSASVVLPSEASFHQGLLMQGHDTSAIAIVLLGSLFSFAANGAQPELFSNMAGAWSGSGQLLNKDGGVERIRCRATYTIDSGGSGLNQVLSCASDSYRFDLKTTVALAGDSLSGSWSEASRNLNGTISGRVNGGKIEALVEANGFSGSLSLNTSGNRQTIAIRSKSSDLQGVDVTLTR